MAAIRRSKYGNTRVCVDGVHYASKGEYNRWCELQLWEQSGGIKELTRQVRFQLEVVTWEAKLEVLENYLADFVYRERVGSQWVYRVEDWKGFRTTDFKRKKKWMKMVHNIEVLETGGLTSSRRR